jgi:hypothetical protein
MHAPKLKPLWWHPKAAPDQAMKLNKPLQKSTEIIKNVTGIWITYFTQNLRTTCVDRLNSSHPSATQLTPV